MKQKETNANVIVKCAETANLRMTAADIMNNFRADTNPYDFAEFKKLINDRTFVSTSLI